MQSLTRVTGPALLAFVAGAVIANVPGLGPWLERIAGAEGARMILRFLAMAMFAALILATLGAASHFRANTALIGPRRSVWYALLWIPVVGAIAYYMRVMRHAE